MLFWSVEGEWFFKAFNDFLTNLLTKRSSSVQVCFSDSTFHGYVLWFCCFSSLLALNHFTQTFTRMCRCTNGSWSQNTWISWVKWNVRIVFSFIPPQLFPASGWTNENEEEVFRNVVGDDSISSLSGGKLEEIETQMTFCVWSRRVFSQQEVKKSLQHFIIT